MSWKQNVAAVAATIISAVAAVLFSSAIAATVDPQSLTALGTSSTTIRLHAYETCKSSKDHSKPRNEVDTSLKSPV